MKEYKEVKIIEGVAAKNKRGQWVPPVPEPYYRLIKRECACGRKFWTDEGYQGHYAYKHILAF